MAGGLIGKGNGRGRYRPMAEINVTPLVDVMLVLLIIFMVTAPLMTTSVNIDLPKVAAIPAVLAYNKISTDLARFASRLEGFGTEFGAILSRQSEERA